ncbi:hypothetical protein ACIGO9_30430 [Nocardia asteroides]|uniref:hypothetical protein n=1 Tax=Nocardia asteroides TaxID=1824 RepID=UPI0037C7A0B5
MLLVTAVDHLSPLPTGDELLVLMLESSNPAQSPDPVRAAAAALVQLHRGWERTGPATAAERHTHHQQLRTIDIAVVRAIPDPVFGTPVHTENVSTAVDRLACLVCGLDRRLAYSDVVAAWCQVDELARGLNARIGELLSGQRRVPHGPWWASFGSCDTGMPA